MAEEAKKVTSQLEESERKLREKTKEVSTIQTKLDELADRVQTAEKSSANLLSEKVTLSTTTFSGDSSEKFDRFTTY